MSVYRFPAMENVESFGKLELLKRIERELMCAYEANRDRDRQYYGMLLLGMIHEAETALRREFSEDEVEELRRRIVERNAMSGCYGTCVEMPEGECRWTLVGDETMTKYHTDCEAFIFYEGPKPPFCSNCGRPVTLDETDAMSKARLMDSLRIAFRDSEGWGDLE